MRLMQWLSVMAVALMLCAPLASRWVQSHGPWGGAVQALMAMPQAKTGAAGESMAGHHHHGQMHMEEAAPAAPLAQERTSPSPSGHDHDGHAQHGEACEYCVLGARLLAALVFTWLLLPLLHARLPRPLRWHAPRTAAPRRAHTPRGPPRLT